MRKDYQMQQDIDMFKQQSWQQVTNPKQQTFGLPNDGEEPKSENEQQ